MYFPGVQLSICLYQFQKTQQQEPVFLQSPKSRHCWKHFSIPWVNLHLTRHAIEWWVMYKSHWSCIGKCGANVEQVLGTCWPGVEQVLAKYGKWKYIGLYWKIYWIYGYMEIFPSMGEWITLGVRMKVKVFRVWSKNKQCERGAPGPPWGKSAHSFICLLCCVALPTGEGERYQEVVFDVQHTMVIGSCVSLASGVSREDIFFPFFSCYSKEVFQEGCE